MKVPIWWLIGAPRVWFFLVVCWILYHMYLVIGMMLRLVSLSEGALGTSSLGLGWPLFKFGTRVGALLFQSPLPYNSGIPSWYSDHNTTLYCTIYFTLSYTRTIINGSVYCNDQNLINYHVLLVKKYCIWVRAKIVLQIL